LAQSFFAASPLLPQGAARLLGPTGGYIFNLKTTAYPTGTYNLQFTAGSDPTLHTTQFEVR